MLRVSVRERRSIRATHGAHGASHLTLARAPEVKVSGDGCPARCSKPRHAHCTSVLGLVQPHGVAHAKHVAYCIRHDISAVAVQSDILHAHVARPLWHTSKEVLVGREEDPVAARCATCRDPALEQARHRRRCLLHEAREQSLVLPPPHATQRHGECLKVDGLTGALGDRIRIVIIIIRVPSQFEELVGAILVVEAE